MVFHVPSLLQGAAFIGDEMLPDKSISCVNTPSQVKVQC